MPAAKHKKSRPTPPPPAAPEAAPATPLPPPPATPVAALPAAPTPWWHTLLAALVIVLAGLLAYSNSFHGDFVLDDLPAIKENRSIQQGWIVPPPPAVQPQGLIDRLFLRLPAPLQPPNDGQTVTARPLVNISFQQNYAWSQQHSPNGQDGFQPTGYHVLSLTIHLLAGLALFGLVHRTLMLPKVRPMIGQGALPVAFAAALLWTIHPLQTESVTYLSQRAESLMGLFYLLALYCFVRGTQSRPWLWFPLSVLSCTTSTFCKEVTATLPVMIALFDYIFIAQNPLEPLKRRWPVYAGYLVAMLPLAVLVAHGGSRGHSAGFGEGLSSFDYAKEQFPAILNYLKLTVWPHPLVLYYGESTDIAGAPFTAGDALAMVVVVGLVAGALLLLWRKPLLGFLGAWFFAILAPSSSFVPVITEVAAEHRMYLSLAALAVFAALGLWKLLGPRVWAGTLAVALALGALTFARNYDYRSGYALWRDTVTKHPDIARAHENLGIMLFQEGRVRESVAEYEAALRIKPNYPDCENNLGNALGNLGENEEAVQHYTRAVNNLIRPGDQAVAAYNLGNSLHALNRLDEAIKAYNFAGSLAHYAPAFNNMGGIYGQQQKYPEAIASYQQAVALDPQSAMYIVNLADSYQKSGQAAPAEQYYLRAIQLASANLDAHAHLGILYNNNHQFAEAVREFAICTQLQPNSPDMHYLLGFALQQQQKPADAAREFETALKLNPNYEAAKNALAQLRASQP